MRLNDLVQARIPQVCATVVSSANQPVQYTLPTPAPGQRWVVWSTLISASAAPASAVAVTAVSNAVTVAAADLLAATPLPAVLPTFRGELGQSVVITLPALGGTTVGRITVAASQVDCDGY